MFTNNTYKIFEQYMLKFILDSAHDKEHIYRVVNLCFEIVKYELGPKTSEEFSVN